MVPSRGGRQLNAKPLGGSDTREVSILKALLAGLALALSGCSLVTRDPANRCFSDDTGPVCTVALVELISRPEIYSGRRVKVVGWLHLEPEGDALYLHREDYERTIAGNSLRFSAPQAFMQRADEFNDEYCLVIATFVAYEAGANTVHSGGLKDVTAVLRIPETREDWNGPFTVWNDLP
jgi:hypothetical protein